MASSVVFACLGICLGLGSPAVAEPRPGTAPTTAGHPNVSEQPESLRRELLARLSSERAWKLVEGLKLDQATSAKMFPILSKYDELFFTLFGERRAIGKQLRTELASPSPNDALLSTLIDNMLTIRARRHTLEGERLAELRRVLSPRQQASLILLLPQIEGGFLRRLRHAHEGDGDDGGGASGLGGRSHQMLSPDDLF
jgi:Spy/CpxP family protein refolding chaperone